MRNLYYLEETQSGLCAVHAATYGHLSGGKRQFIAART